MSTYAYAAEAPNIVLVDQNGYDIFSGVLSCPAEQVPLLERVVIIDQNGNYTFG